MNIDDYLKDWEVFRKYIEQKAKDKCVITNKNWLKLRDFHFENFILTVKHPFGFLFKMLYMSKEYKNIPCIHSVYGKYRRAKIQEITNKMPTTSFIRKEKC